jgi:hypothetical protein
MGINLCYTPILSAFETVLSPCFLFVCLYSFYHEVPIKGFLLVIIVSHEERKVFFAL